MSGREPLLKGLAFAGYRSFAHEPQRLLFPTPVTVLAGVNNSGKSNVLGYVQHVLPQLRTKNGARIPQKGVSLDDLDVPKGYRERSDHIVSIPLTYTPLTDRELDQCLQRGHGDIETLQRAAMTLIGVDGVMWPEFVVTSQGLDVAPRQAETLAGAVKTRRARPGAAFSREAFENAAQRAIGGGVSSRLEDVAQGLIRSLHQFASVPPVATISASRRVEKDAEDEGPDTWMSGRGLIKRLAALQNPVSGDWAVSRAKWDAINKFVQHVLDDPQSRINIPHDASAIQIETPRRVLPLANLGTGIEQVIVLAAAATIPSETLVCMEEPESNLHPLLQRKLVRYLNDETSNQYLIATHSAHFLDHESASVYHLQLTEDGTKASHSRSPNDLVGVCNDLGYRPSDLMQANCVIWVEGPSDRLYLRRWLELCAPELVEGVHYKVMFYGGSLLTHLTVNDQTAKEAVNEAVAGFVNLRLLNRASVVVMDSDRTSPRSSLKPAVQRIKAEYDTGEGTGHAWVTNGYTIENYLPSGVLREAMTQVHPSKKFVPVGKWENPLPGDGLNKTAIARAAVPLLTAENYLTHDLKKQLSDITRFIHAANQRLAVTDSTARD